MLTRSLSCVCAAIATLLIAGLPAWADHAGNTVKAQIPFEFLVAGKSMPAGDYSLEFAAGNPIVTVRSRTGMVALTYMSRLQPAPGPQEKPRLVFEKTAGKYLLKEVWTAPKR